jgi:hypothetical protein
MNTGTIKSTTTDSRGFYRIDHLPPGQYVVFKSRMEPQSENIFFDLVGNMRLKTARVRDGERSRLDIHDESEDGVRVWGYVRDQGKPVSRAMVTALASDRSGPFGVGVRADTSDGDGKYELMSLSPGTYFLQVAAAGPQRGPRMTTLSLEVPEDRREYRFDILIPTGSIAGVIRDSSGQPVPRARIRAGLLDGETPEGLLGLVMRNGFNEARADNEGRYELKGLAAGSYRLVASTQRFGRGNQSGEAAKFGEAILEPVQVDGATAIQGMDFVLPQAARITGIVVDGNGGPVLGAEVLYTREGEKRERQATDLFGLPMNTVKTDVHGGFVLEGLTPGGYTVTARMKDLTPAEESGLIVSEGGESQVRLVLIKGATLRIKVIDIAGGSVPIGDVQILDSKGQPVVRRYSALELMRMAFSGGRKEGDDTGWYEIGNIKPDTYTAVIRQQGKPELRFSREVRDGEKASWEVSMKALMEANK